MTTPEKTRLVIFVGSRRSFIAYLAGIDPSAVQRRNADGAVVGGIRYVRCPSSQSMRGLTGPAELVVAEDARLTTEEWAEAQENMAIINRSVRSGADQ